MLVAKRQKKKEKKKKEKRKKRNNSSFKPNNEGTKTKLSVLLYSLAIVLMCIYLLSRYADTTKIQMELTNKDKEIEILREKKKVLRLELEEIKSSGYIEKQAKIRMNMRRANKDQVILIDVK